MLVYSSTQHPSEVQHKVAHALGRRQPSRGQSRCRRMGGGFGGKESQPALLACAPRCWRAGSAGRSSCASTATTT